jgi:hypothetical protein
MSKSKKIVKTKAGMKHRNYNLYLDENAKSLKKKYSLKSCFVLLRKVDV